MNEEDRRKIISNEYADFFVEYDMSAEGTASNMNETLNKINEKYAVIYSKVNEINQQVLQERGYAAIPNLFGLVNASSLEEMGVKKLQNIPFLNLRGQGVLLGFVDTGIEYTNPLFKNADNTTRILSIWDQTIENLSASQEIFYYGTEYNREQINQALQNEVPLSIVPSTDEVGHGTALAGLAGGSSIEQSDFVGVAPLAEYVIVKLKTAKQNLKQFVGVPEGFTCYQENDIIFGLQYLANFARRIRKPIAICLGLGTNQGSHDGRSTISDVISLLSNRAGIAIAVAAGNEGNRAHHYYGEINKTVGYNTVELKVGDNENDFTMELWGNLPGKYSIDILSPSGEYVPRIPARVKENREVHFIFENTVIHISYFIVEAQSGDELILIRFTKPTPGLWRFNVYGGNITSGFHIWLPMYGFISENTYFTQPNPDTTITGPGNTEYAITVTAYDHIKQSIYINASRGYTRTNIIKPEITAPGVDVYTPTLGNAFNQATGTSISAALTTGAIAMLLEWGIVKGNDKTMDTLSVKKYLIRGVKRSDNIVYPNKEWGFGILDIYGTFEDLRGER